MDVPIPKYPAFALRSSLIEKDPVIWVHLLENYLHLCTLVAKDEIELSEKSTAQFVAFVKSFLAETAGEIGKVLLLGVTNKAIVANVALLRAQILQLIKKGPRKMALNGEDLWNVTKVYVEKNVSAVRGLVNSQLCEHLLDQISSDKFGDDDLRFLSALFGKATLVSTASLEGRHKSKGKLGFALRLVDSNWILRLEQIGSETARKVLIVTLVALLAQEIAALMSKIVTGSDTSAAPVTCSILKSPQFKEICPIEDTMPFLKEDDGVAFLQDMFPVLSTKRAHELLEQHTLEEVTTMILEDPALAEPEPEISVTAAEIEREMRRFEIKENETNVEMTKKALGGDTTKQTLNAALRLLYESDEDERDDTYDANERTTGGEELIDFTLFCIYKKYPEAFEKSQRRTKERGHIKSETKWSDEQLEGWWRMLQRSPRRFRILEEEYLLGKGRKQATKVETDESDEDELSVDTTRESKKTAAKKEPLEKVGDKSKKKEPLEKAGDKSKKKEPLEKAGDKSKRDRKWKETKNPHNRKLEHAKKVGA